MRFSCLSAVAISLAAWVSAPFSAAFAQEHGLPIVTAIEGDYVAAGAGVMTDYNGSDDYSWGVAPAFRYELGGGRNVSLTGNFLAADLVPHPRWRLGPAALYRFGRRDVEDEVVALVDEIDPTVEAGVSGGYTWWEPTNPRNRVSLSATVMADLGGRYDGYTAGLNLIAMREVARPVDIALVAGVGYGDDGFAETYFGVSQREADRSGLAPFRPDGGATSVYAAPAVILHFSEAWHVGAGVQWRRIMGEAADSPLVAERGDEDQFIIGAGFAYAWGFNVQ